MNLRSIDVPYAANGHNVGSLARVFVRPHDVTIDMKTNGLPAITAKVLRVHSAGPVVRVELLTSAGQSLAAELSQERFGTMPLEPGTPVFVRPRHIRVFSEGSAPASMDTVGSSATVDAAKTRSRNGKN